MHHKRAGKGGSSCCFSPPPRSFFPSQEEEKEHPRCLHHFVKCQWQGWGWGTLLVGDSGSGWPYSAPTSSVSKCSGLGPGRDCWGSIPFRSNFLTFASAGSRPGQVGTTPSFRACLPGGDRMHAAGLGGYSGRLVLMQAPGSCIKDALLERDLEACCHTVHVQH